jgi:hypothetical protein
METLMLAGKLLSTLLVLYGGYLCLAPRRRALAPREVERVR